MMGRNPPPPRVSAPMKSVILEKIVGSPRVVVRVAIDATTCWRVVKEATVKAPERRRSYVDRGNIGTVDGFTMLPLWNPE
jgi:hypothetical protein